MSKYPLHEKAFAYVEHCLGVHESPAHSNRGPIQVHKPEGGVSYFEQHDFLLGEGYAWCVTLDLTAWEVGAKHPLPYKSPSAHGQGDYWRKHGHAVHAADLIPGDLIDWNVGSGHMSMFEKIQGGMIHTIDGNSADMVRRCQRSIGLVRTAIHIPEDPAKLPPPPEKKPFWVIATSENGHRQLLFTKYAAESFILKTILPPLVKKYGKAGITITRGGVKQ